MTDGQYSQGRLGLNEVLNKVKKACLFESVNIIDGSGFPCPVSTVNINVRVTRGIPGTAPTLVIRIRPRDPFQFRMTPEIMNHFCNW